MGVVPSPFLEVIVKFVKSMLPVLLMILGLGLLLYPHISDYVNRRNSSYILEEMTRKIADVDAEEAEHQRTLAQQYNSGLLQGEEGENYSSILDFGGGVMGAVQIPQIHVNLPIYHGVSEEVLSKGVGHMPNSAFPIGGEGNHAVLTGHTGLPSAKLLTDLTELQEGDLFHVRILEETLTYRVDQIKVVLPDDGTALAAEPGKDYCTLLTCTPYGVNSHRLLVRGERTETAQAEKEIIEELPDEQKPIPWRWIAVGAGSVFLVSVSVLIWLLRRKR